MNLRHIKIDITFALQRAFREYDDKITHGWGLEYPFSLILIQVKKFCEYQMSDKAHLELSPKRKKVFTTTLQMIKDWEECDDNCDIIKDGYFKKEYLLSKAMVHISKNMGYYWD